MWLVWLMVVLVVVVVVWILEWVLGSSILLLQLLLLLLQLLLLEDKWNSADTTAGPVMLLVMDMDDNDDILCYRNGISTNVRESVDIRMQCWHLQLMVVVDWHIWVCTSSAMSLLPLEQTNRVYRSMTRLGQECSRSKSKTPQRIFTIFHKWYI